MSTSAVWSWWNDSPHTATAFTPADAAVIEADFLLDVFWGDDPEQKTETGWCKLPGDRIIDFARMRQIRPDAPGLFDTVQRDANVANPNSVVSEGRHQTAELQIRTEGPAAPLVSPQPLVAACLTGNAHDVRMLLLQFTEFANAVVDEKSQATVLHIAASAGHLACVRCLVACGAGTEARTKTGATPMHAAAKSGALDVIKFLASAGASPGSKTAGGSVPLHVASQHGHTAVVRYFIEEVHGDPNVTNDDGVTPLILACEMGHTDVLLQLVTAGAHVNQRDNEGVAPVLAAAHFGHMETVHALLTAGAEYEDVKVNTVTEAGLRPVFSAAQRGSLGIVQLLLAAGAPPNPTYGEGDDAFDAAEAAQFNNHEALAEKLTDGSLLNADQMLQQLAGMGGSMDDDDDSGHPKYLVTKRVAVNRNFEDTGGTHRLGFLEQGMVVSALETRGLGSAELRIRFEHETVRGWANCDHMEMMEADYMPSLEDLYSGGAAGGSGASQASFPGSWLVESSSDGGSQSSGLRVSQGTFAQTGMSFSADGGFDMSAMGGAAEDSGVAIGTGRGGREMTPADFGSPRATALGSYRALSKLVVRQAREVGSKKKGSLAAGTVIKALEIVDVPGSKPGMIETRLLFSGGWVSMLDKGGMPALQEVEALQPWETPIAEKHATGRRGSNGSTSSTAWRQPSGNSSVVPPLRSGNSMERRQDSAASSMRSASESGFTVASGSTERAGSRTGSASSNSRVPSISRSNLSFTSETGMPSASPSASSSYARRNSGSRSGSASQMHPVGGYLGGGGGLGEMPRAGPPHPLATQQGYGAPRQVQAAPVDDYIPPPPVEAPPQLAPPPGAKMFTLQIEPHALVPGGKRLQVAAVDLTGLRVEIGRQLGLKDLKLQFFDNDFDEWCALATFDDVDSGAAETKLKVTDGTRLPMATAPPVAAATAPAQQRFQQPLQMRPAQPPPQRAPLQQQQVQQQVMPGRPAAGQPPPTSNWSAARTGMGMQQQMQQQQAPRMQQTTTQMQQMQMQQRQLQQAQAQQQQMQLQQQRQLMGPGGGLQQQQQQQQQRPQTRTAQPPPLQVPGNAAHLVAQHQGQQQRQPPQQQAGVRPGAAPVSAKDAWEARRAARAAQGGGR